MWPEGRPTLYPRVERSLIVDNQTCWDVLGASTVKLPEIPRLLVLEFRAVVPRVPRAYSALFRGDGNSAFGRSGCADHARNSRIYCADREIAQLLIIVDEHKMCSGYHVSAHSSKVR